MDNIVDALKLGLKHIRVERRHIQNNLKNVNMYIELKPELLKSVEEYMDAEMLIMADIANHQKSEGESK